MDGYQRQTQEERSSLNQQIEDLKKAGEEKVHQSQLELNRLTQSNNQLAKR